MYERCDDDKEKIENLFEESAGSEEGHLRKEHHERPLSLSSALHRLSLCRNDSSERGVPKNSARRWRPQSTQHAQLDWIKIKQFCNSLIGHQINFDNELTS